MNSNEYHNDSQINEMLSFLDNAHDIFSRIFGKEYPQISDDLVQLYAKIDVITKYIRHITICYACQKKTMLILMDNTKMCYHCGAGD